MANWMVTLVQSGPKAEFRTFVSNRHPLDLLAEMQESAGENADISIVMAVPIADDTYNRHRHLDPQSS